MGKTPDGGEDGKTPAGVVLSTKRTDTNVVLWVKNPLTSRNVEDVDVLPAELEGRLTLEEWQQATTKLLEPWNKLPPFYPFVLPFPIACFLFLADLLPEYQLDGPCDQPAVNRYDGILG